jgi:hypothetical protein
MTVEVEDAREDLRRVLDGCSDGEVAAVRNALVAGEIDGWTYQSLGNARGCVLSVIAHERDVDALMDRVDFARALSVGALEDWAALINAGDTPDHTAPESSGPFRAALLVSWIDEWRAEA